MCEWVKRAKVGDKVVCIKETYQPPAGVVMIDIPVVPELGKVYTIREITVGIVGQIICIKVDEIADQHLNLLFNGVPRIGGLVFEADLFRPVQPRTYDISIFTRLLNTAPAEMEEV